jgi:hypothetical protein
VKLKSLRSTRLGAGAAVVALIGAAVLMPASTAFAGSNEPPVIAELYCDSWGTNQFFCSMTIEGGITPDYTYWSSGGNVSSFGSQGTDYTLGTCATQGSYTQVNVIVRDGYGYYSQQQSFGFTCE